MKRLHLCILILTFFITTIVSAQNPYAESQQQINKIKMDTLYLYSTGTSSVSAKDATQNSRELLALEIEMWLKQIVKADKQTINGYVIKANEHLAEIPVQRGNLYRSFSYVRKADILPYSNKSELLLVELPEEVQLPQTTTVDDNKAPSEMADKQDESDNKELARETEINKDSEKPVLTADEEKILAVKNFDGINTFLTQLDKEGRIKDKGKYSTLPDNKDCYIFIYDKDGNIPACLKQNQSGQINLKLGLQDNVRNYKGCGAIWFILK